EWSYRVGVWLLRLHGYELRQNRWQGELERIRGLWSRSDRHDNGRQQASSVPVYDRCRQQGDVEAYGRGEGDALDNNRESGRRVWRLKWKDGDRDLKLG